MFSLATVIFIALAWVIPFWIGIQHLRQGLRSGVTLCTMSALWGLGAIIIAGAVIVGDNSTAGHKSIIRIITWYGWIILVCLSIICLRKHDRGGYALAGLGGLWAVFGLYMISISTYQAITGSPYTAYIDATQQGQDTILLELKITGNDGKDYKVWHFRDIKNPPKVQALSASGKVLWQATMHYG